MSNNQYTSPRVYLSRGYKPKTKTKRTPFEMGMGYALEALPPGMTRSDFKALYTEWESKLQNSGFNDIEYRSPSHTGHTTPFFRENGSTATFMRAYDPAKEEYYRLARHFDTFMNEAVGSKGQTRWSKAFKGQARLYKTIWYLHIEGVPYRAVAKAFSGKPSKWLRGLKSVPPSLVGSKSVFWAHDHTHKVLDLFWKWAKNYEHGFNDPRDVTAPPTK
jgi:hypothetical protein